LAKKYLTALEVASLASDPANGKRGQVYYNITTNKFRGYTTLWQDLGSGSGGGGGLSTIFFDYQGQGKNNNQYFVLGQKSQAPSNPLVDDLWVVTDDAEEVPYFIATQTSAPDPAQYEFWADPSDYGGDIIYTSSVEPVGEYEGQLYINPDDVSRGEITQATSAPNYLDYNLWVDTTDVDNLAQYAQVYNTVSDFPSAAQNPGLIVVEAQYGRPYYSYNNAWLGISALSDSNQLLNIANETLTYLQYVDSNNLNNQTLYWMNAGL